jgi:hypothetical protein
MKPLHALLSLLLLLLAPLAGAYLAGAPMEEYLVFPPMTTELTMYHEGFSSTIFWLMLLAIVVVVGPFFFRVMRRFSKEKVPWRPRRPFPAWGWAGLALMLGGWLLAWTRFPWMENLQTFTFTPPWLGYIILVNALTQMRSGRCMLTHQPRLLLALFLVSAVFWWYFEYLNLLVENWYYVNVGELSNWQFFWYATLPFSTVLPAVLSTRDLLATFPGFSAGLGNFQKVRIPDPNAWAWVILLLSLVTLAAIHYFPNQLFFMLWLAPLGVLVSMNKLAAKQTIFSGIARGRWRELYLLGMAALVCGFFWELWNYGSYTRWEYAVPYVNRYHLFEMPALGYAGYLPFGLQCGVVASWVEQWAKK